MSTSELSTQNNSDTSKSVEFYSVESVESPEILVLTAGHRIRLLGIRSIPDRPHEACEFLRRITEDQRVFMKQDKVKMSGLDEPLVYIYLENGSFLNALLVKYDLVDVDESIPFKYRERFIKRQKDNRAQEN